MLIAVSPAIAQRSRLQIAPEKVTHFKVVESAYFLVSTRNVFEITSDSIIVDLSDGEDHSHFSKAITATERDLLLQPFNRIYLSSIKSRYYSKVGGVDDGNTFNVFITKGEATKAIQIENCKWEPLYQFSKKLNMLLPPNFKIDYNDSYFLK